MAKRKITNLFIYRRRVLLGYLFVFFALAGCLAIALFIPGGITASEKTSVVRSLSPQLLDVNAPYHLLQRASLSLFGLSVFAIKLPSVLLGLLLGTSLFLLLRRWLSLAIAVFSALIIFAGTTFLSVTGTGSPVVLYILYPTLLIYIGTRMLAHDRGLVAYAILLLITIAAALLTPSMIYLVALAIALAIFNPHIRYGFRRLPVYGLVLLGLGLVAAVGPLVLLLVKHPTARLTILALPETVSPTVLMNNVNVLWSLFARFLHPTVTLAQLAPLIGLATAGLAILGLYRTIRGIYTARAQFIVGWSVIALVLAVLDTDYAILLYLPVVLLASIGLSHLASIWYRTFPLNPYARVTALAPIGILIAGIVAGSLARYVNTTLYAKESARLYSYDLQILRTASVKVFPEGPVTLLVPQSDVAFYGSITKPGKIGRATVITYVRPLSDAPDANGKIISARQLDGRGSPTRILTDSRAWQADRFYVYK